MLGETSYKAVRLVLESARQNHHVCSTSASKIVQPLIRDFKYQYCPYICDLSPKEKSLCAPETMWTPILSYPNLLLVLFYILSREALANGLQQDHELSSLRNVEFYQPTNADLERLRQARASSNEAVSQVNSSSNPVNKTKPESLHGVTDSQIRDARAVVADAHATQAAYNKWLIENPRRNIYKHRQPDQPLTRRDNAMEVPTFSDEVFKAIRLVGDADAWDMYLNKTLPVLSQKQRTPRGSSHQRNVADQNDVPDLGAYWLGRVNHTGTMPFGNDSSYQVWPLYQSTPLLWLLTRTCVRSGVM